MSFPKSVNLTIPDIILPMAVFKLLDSHQVILAGGYIRSLFDGLPQQDIDLFCQSRESFDACKRTLKELSVDLGYKIDEVAEFSEVSTYEICEGGKLFIVQLCFVDDGYSSPDTLISNFDFTASQFYIRKIYGGVEEVAEYKKTHNLPVIVGEISGDLYKMSQIANIINVDGINLNPNFNFYVFCMRTSISDATSRKIEIVKFRLSERQYHRVLRFVARGYSLSSASSDALEDLRILLYDKKHYDTDIKVMYGGWKNALNPPELKKHVNCAINLNLINDRPKINFFDPSGTNDTVFRKLNDAAAYGYISKQTLLAGLDISEDCEDEIYKLLICE